ncbi:hypothetical protein AB4Y95_18445 [Arthrobacter sp. M-10]|uniref:hypothetical protein n=1 Tax=Arthrobacter sp. M-10 TaxID=3233037 RepID=UPI003F92BD12
MTSHESRAGDRTTFGPLQLQSIWHEHELRNFDLMVIMQVSGCEHIAERVISGESVSTEDKSALVIANEIAEQKGYLPLFDVTDDDARISENAGSELEKFFRSEEWQTRDRSSTRRL